MGAWASDSKSHVASMGGGDFYGSEKSTTAWVVKLLKLRSTLSVNDGSTKTLKDSFPIQFRRGEVIDCFGHEYGLRLKSFHRGRNCQMRKANGVLFSLHMKATMMKVSDPIIFRSSC